MQDRLKDEAKINVEKSLKREIETTSQAVRSWLKKQRATAMGWADSPHLLKAAEELLPLSGKKERLLASPGQARLSSWLSPLDKGQGYKGYFIIGPGNMNLASYREGYIGNKSFLSGQNGFLEKLWAGQSRVIVQHSSQPLITDSKGNLDKNLPSIFSGAPIKNRSGKVIALFVLQMDPRNDFSAILGQSRIGDRGEAYAFDREGVLFSESRFSSRQRERQIISSDKTGLLNIIQRKHDLKSSYRDEEPPGGITRNSITENPEIHLDYYRNYRGVPVIGAWLWEADSGFGITAEINENESFESFRSMQRVISLITFLSFLLLLGLTAIYIVRRRDILENKNHLKQIIDLIPGMIHVKDREGRFILVNKGAADAYGTTEDELVKRHQEDSHPSPDEIEAIIRAEMGVVQSGAACTLSDEEFIGIDGKKRFLHLVRIPYEVSPSKGPLLLTVATDITEQKEAEKELQLTSILFKSTTEGMIITDSKPSIIAVNKAYTDITGYEPEEVLGRNPGLVKSGRHDKMFYKNMWGSILKGGYWQGEIWNRRKNGEIFPVLQNISAVRDDKGTISHYVSVFSDISSIKRSHKMLDHLAHHDVLTDLPNRMLFEDRFKHAMSRARREGQKLALFFIDLDRFKDINDSLGHPVGDGLLQEVAKRLIESVREEDTVARLGGDEFTVIMEKIEKEEHAATLARRLMNAFETPFIVREHELHITPSLGISIYPRDGENIEDLLKNADIAMYRAKEEGRNNYQFYTEKLMASVLERVSIETKLRHALDSNELFLHYQPQFSLETGRIIGAEALIRWKHPELGMVSPVRFIPLAEDTGLIIPIGEWVLRTGCLQMQKWHEEGLHMGRLSINVSGVQIQRGGIVETVMKALEETGLDPRSLELEITESTIMHDTKPVVDMMNELKELGVQLAIDDFGTGFSCLSQLRHLPIDKLKIDRSFVRDIPRDLNAEAIARAVIALGQTLHLRVIAEGVETKEQEDFLLAEGCIEVQGYKYSHPLPVDELTALLEASLKSR